MSEDFSDFCGDNNEDNFLSVRDSYGRTALHVAAAGSSSLMVEYLLTHSRVCLERVKHNEMKQLIEVRFIYMCGLHNVAININFLSNRPERSV